MKITKHQVPGRMSEAEPARDDQTPPVPDTSPASAEAVTYFLPDGTPQVCALNKPLDAAGKQKLIAELTETVAAVWRDQQKRCGAIVMSEAGQRRPKLALSLCGTTLPAEVAINVLESAPIEVQPTARSSRLDERPPPSPCVSSFCLDGPLTPAEQWSDVVAAVNAEAKGSKH